MIKSIVLPRLTDSTDHGPIVYARGRTVSLKYDYQQSDGTTDWTEIEFNGVLAYRFDEWTCAEDDSYINFRKMAECDSSPWLVKKLDKWQREVGHYQFQIDKGGRSRFKHYMIYFDDQGTFEVICSGYQITPPSA